MTEAADIVAPRRIDVSHLPEDAWDSHAPVWWGNLLAILIETSTLAIMLVTYFYIKRNFGQWPPPQVHSEPPIGNPNPDLLWGTLNLVLLVAACVPMYICDMAARKKDARRVLMWLGLMAVVSLLVIWFRFYEFKAFHYRWDHNAYGSAVWWLLGLHLTYLFTCAGEFIIMWIWIIVHSLDEKHALDVTLAGGAWYWTAATWVIVYTVLYWSPRVFG